MSACRQRKRYSFRYLPTCYLRTSYETTSKYKQLGFKNNKLEQHRHHDTVGTNQVIQHHIFMYFLYLGMPFYVSSVRLYVTELLQNGWVIQFCVRDFG